MKILILPGEKYQPCSTDKPKDGFWYNLEPAEEHTDSQHKTAEALITEYWKSGIHPKYGGDEYSTFRDKMKRDLGAGFASYIYADIVNKKPKIFDVKSVEEIPEHIRLDPDMKSMIRGKLKSLTRYTKKELANFIDNLLNDMVAAGCNSKKFQEICQGLKDNELKRMMKNDR